jgi:hypothetical protein
VQFVNNHIFNAQNIEIDDFLTIGPVGTKFFRQTKTWYADVDKDQASPWYKPSVTTTDTESIWDEPEAPRNADFPKAILEFQSCLLCRPTKCDVSDPYLPAFQVSWTFTKEYLQLPQYDVQSGESISKMPGDFAGKDWVVGVQADHQTKITVKSPIFFGENW